MLRHSYLRNHRDGIYTGMLMNGTLNAHLEATDRKADEMEQQLISQLAQQENGPEAKKDDTLVVKSIDRLGRNYEEILEQWRIITREKQAAIVVLDMPLLDTRQNRDLTGTLIADIVLQLLSYVAQTEREFIRQRQAEGIAAAKRNGKRLGRPPLPQPEGFDDICIKCKTGQISTRQAAQILGMKHSTFYKNMQMRNRNV